MGKVKEFVKKHKDVIPYVIGAGIGLTLLCVAGVKAKNRSTLEDLDHPELEEGKSNSEPYTDLETKYVDHPEMDKGTFSYLLEWNGGKYNGCHSGHMKEVPVSDLGKVGDTLKQCDGFDENSKISFMFTDYTEK